MELEPQEGRSSGSFTSAQLSSISLRGLNKSHQRQIFGTQITPAILFLCLQWIWRSWNHVMPFKWFISLKRISSEPGCTQTLLSQTSLTRSDLPQQRSKWGPPIPATSTLITCKRGSKHCLSFLGIFSQEVRDPAVSPQANSLYLGEKKYFLVLFLEFREKIRI